MDLLMGKVASILENEASLILGLRDDLEEIQRELDSMKSLLEDTESQKEHSEVDKTCMANVRDLVYKIGDTIDEFTYHANHQRGGGRIADILYQIIYFPKNLWIKHQIATKLLEIKKAVKNNAERWERNYVNRKEGKSEHSDKWVQNHGEAALFMKKEDFVGMERKKTDLMGSLMDGDSRQTVVSLIGMGGSGKTTLAANIYCDESIKRYFDCHAWITVSQTYVIEELFRSLLKEFHQSRKEKVSEDLNAKSYKDLVQLLRNYLETKRYLVVLDDVWDIRLWEQIEVSFPDRKTGSRIVLTTRKEDVALRSSGDESRIHRIQPLLPNDAWKLFCMKAFSSYPDKSCPEEFEEIAAELLEKCEGLPLAIVALGGMMSTKKSKLEWSKVCKNLNWLLNEDPSLEKVNKILLLSFNNLPYRLKHCFLYCSLFPEDYLIRRKRLIRLWMAEGFVEQRPGSTCTPEEVADGYLMELVSLSMLVVVHRNPSGRPKACKMHDLMRELALTVSGRENFGAIYDGREDMEKCGARRLSIIQTTDKEIASWNGMSQLRTFLVFVPLFYKMKLPFGFKLLRVLDLENIPIEKLPDELVYLFNLRYLNLRGTSVQELPKSIGRLRNLQTLIIRDTKIVKLPKGITKLQNLRHLLMYHYCPGGGSNFRYVRGTQAPSKITKLKKLQVLSCIISEGDLIQQIGNMTQLTRLGITEVKGSDELDLCVSLQKLRLLHYLFLMVTDEEETLRLDAISSPPPLLQTLILTGKLEKVPRWISSLHNLETLYLHWSRLVEDLLPHIARLPCLGYLCLVNAYARETMYFREGFLKLSRLTLINFPQLHAISIGKGLMPDLQELNLSECNNLKTLPMGIECLSNLQELDLTSMPMELIESIRVGGVDRPKVQHIPSIGHYYQTPFGIYMYESLSQWNA